MFLISNNDFMVLEISMMWQWDLGLKARTTEKIAHGRRVIMFKHTSCEVVGWDLQVAGRNFLQAVKGY